MALPTNRIYLRSPYYVNLERAALTKIVVELYVYTGTLTTDKPADYQYRVISTAYLNDSGNYFAEVDIAELARDFVDVTYDFGASDPTNAVWVEYDLYYADTGDTDVTLEGSYKLTGLNGYGYFEDGYNPNPSDRLLQSSSYILLEKLTTGNIPVLQDYLSSIEYYKNNQLSPTPIATVTPGAVTENTANVIYYATTSNSGGIADYMIFKYSGGKADQRVNITYVEECKWDVVDVAFVNRFGAVQHIFMFGKSTRDIAVESSKYKQNILTGSGSYDTKKHQHHVLEKNGVNSITVNTGWYPEDANGIFQELMLSEKAWMEVPSGWLNYNNYFTEDITAPVFLRNKELQYKTQLNDKLINYTFTFDFASDRINSVR